MSNNAMGGKGRENYLLTYIQHIQFSIQKHRNISNRH